VRIECAFETRKTFDYDFAMKSPIRDFYDLRTYRTAYKHAMEIFKLSQKWPSVEDYALTDQIRRSSRSVCSNMAEAWGKRRYTSHFVSKLSDAESEAAETITWIDLARSCGYVTQETHEHLREKYGHIRGGLIKMMSNPDPWCGPSLLREPNPIYNVERSPQDTSDSSP